MKPIEPFVLDAKARAEVVRSAFAKPPSLRSIEALLWAMQKRRPASGPGLAPAGERG